VNLCQLEYFKTTWWYKSQESNTEEIRLEEFIMIARAEAKYVRISPTKVRPVIALIKKWKGNWNNG